MTRERIRTLCLDVLHAGLRAVDPGDAVRRCLRREGAELRAEDSYGHAATWDLRRFEEVRILGAGKASAAMCAALEGLLEEDLPSRGLVAVKPGYGAGGLRTRLVEAGHPTPDEAGERAAREVLELARTAGPEHLVVALISGGASALLPLPAAPVTLDAMRTLTEALLGAGATIDEINAVRKHLSGLKGGQLSKAAYPATVVGLLVSDVVGDRLDVIGSGPTVADPSTFEDARRVLERYDLWLEAPEEVRTRIEGGCRGDVEETPKAGDGSLGTTTNLLVATNRTCLDACAARARELGFEVQVENEPVVGEARERGDALARRLRALQRDLAPGDPPRCLVSGGETTVHVTGDGKGGRNQELALAAAIALDGTEGLGVLSAGTDGTDNVDDAAGAMAFGDALDRAKERGVDAHDHLNRNDSFPFFEALGDLVVTGPTKTNVMDVQIAVAFPSDRGA